MAKLWFAGPRPYWVSEKVIPYAAENTFGVPSGHAQNAVSVWGIMASAICKPWAWITAIVIIFFIGFSRWFLGVHFVHDGVLGWLIGALILWLFVRFAEPVIGWFKRQPFVQQVLIAFVASLILIGLGWASTLPLAGYTFPAEWADNALRAGPLPNPVSMEGFITSGGTLFGLTLGIAWLATRGGYQASGPVGKRALRYVIGLVGVLLFWKGLDMVFPSTEDLAGFFFRYLRYGLVGLWISAGAPFLFFHFKLASKSKM